MASLLVPYPIMPRMDQPVFPSLDGLQPRPAHAILRYGDEAEEYLPGLQQRAGKSVSPVAVLVGKGAVEP